MEGCCSFKALVGGVCGYNAKDRKRGTEIVPLMSCDKDINRHKSLYKFTGPENEVELILCRAAMSVYQEQKLELHDDMSEPPFETRIRLEPRVQH